MNTYYLIVKSGDAEHGYSFGARDFNEATNIAAAFVAGCRLMKPASDKPMIIDSLTTRRTRGVIYEALL